MGTRKTVVMHQLWSGQELLNSFSDLKDAYTVARERERETGFRVGGTYNRIRTTTMEWPC